MKFIYSLLIKYSIHSKRIYIGFEKVFFYIGCENSIEIEIGFKVINYKFQREKI